MSNILNHHTLLETLNKVIPTTPEPGKMIYSESFWDYQAQVLLIMLSLHLLYANPDRELSLADVSIFLKDKSKSLRQKLEEIISSDYVETAPEGFQQMQSIRETAKCFLERSDRELSCIHSTTAARLSCYTVPSDRDAVMRSH